MTRKNVDKNLYFSSVSESRCFTLYIQWCVYVDGVLCDCGKGSLRDFVYVVLLLCLMHSLPNETQRNRTVTMSSQSRALCMYLKVSRVQHQSMNNRMLFFAFSRKAKVGNSWLIIFRQQNILNLKVRMCHACGVNKTVSCQSD